VLQQRVADHAATQPGQDRQDREADRVQPLGTRHHPAQHRVREHARQVDAPEQVAQRSRGPSHPLIMPGRCLI
jgi:hypothetical protein